MSEYQYYEFTALDQPLTSRQRAELRACSTRAEITATSFINEYEWGDLKADPMDWMARYFDAHVYTSNWGVCNFMLSLPQQLLDQYLDDRRDTGQAFSMTAANGRLILAWTLNLDGGDGFDDYGDDGLDEYGGGGWMERLQPLREELLRGDLRPLYLGWMALLCGEELDDDVLEPPVPPGLRQLTPAQAALAEFLMLDPDLLSVAAQASADLAEPDGADGADDDQALSGWIDQLPVAQLRHAARMLLSGAGRDAERALRISFIAWQKEWSAWDDASPGTAAPRRTVAQIEAGREAAERVRREQERRAREEQEQRLRAARDKQLAAVAARADAIWPELDALLEQGTGTSYGQAERIIKELAAALALAGRDGEFRSGLARQLERHGKRPAWLKRLTKAGLV